MQIGQFVARLQTTKETVRHYEELNLITPSYDAGRRRFYGDAQILEFEVIRELKSMGMGLKEIQLLFAMKSAFGCGDQTLVAKAILHLNDHLTTLRQEEADLHVRIQRLEEQLEALRGATAKDLDAF